MSAKRLALFAAAAIISSAALCAQPPQGGRGGPQSELMRQAQQAIRDGKPDEALAVYRKELAANPNSFQANNAAGTLLDLMGNSAEARKQFGYHTGGDEGFYTRLTARANLTFFASMNNITGERAAERIARISEWLGLGDDLDRQVRTLSTGMTHRLGLARAMLHEPGILLLDEPTRSLDPIAASEFRRLLKDEIVRREGTTLLFASHTPREVEEIADRVVLLDEGRVVANETPQRLCASAGTRTLDEAIGRLVRHPVHAESVQ